jgi:hypothetical protein
MRQFTLERRGRQGSCQEDGLVAAALAGAADVCDGKVVSASEGVRGGGQPHALPVGQQEAVAVPVAVSTGVLLRL